MRTSIKDFASYTSLASAAAICLSTSYSFGFFLRVDVDLVTTLNLADYIALGIRGLPFVFASSLVGFLLGFYRHEKREQWERLGLTPQPLADEKRIGNVKVRDIDKWIKDKKHLRYQLYFFVGLTVFLYIILPQGLQMLMVPAVFGTLLVLYLNFDHEHELYNFSRSLLFSVQAFIVLVASVAIGFSSADRKLANAATEYQINLKSSDVVLADFLASTEKYLMVQAQEPKRVLVIPWDDVQGMSKTIRSNQENLEEAATWFGRIKEIFLKPKTDN